MCSNGLVVIGLALVAASLAGSAPGGTISGTVYLTQGQNRRPMPGVHVLLRRLESGVLIQTASTDVQGRYSFRELPRGRVSVAASKPGYFSRAIASGESKLTLELAGAESLLENDFEMFRGAVITGRITDSSNEPLEAVKVSAYRLNGAAGMERSPDAVAPSDDRGNYRLFGLEPGRYVLLARPTQRFQDEPAVLYFPGTSDPSRARQIEVAAGSELTAVDIAVRPESTSRISGRMEETKAGSQQIFLEVSRAEGVENQRPASVIPIGVTGEFAVAGLPPGTYILEARARPVSGGILQPLARQVIELRSDLTNILLRPTRPGRMEGRVLFPQAGSSRPIPESVRIRLSQRGPFPPVFALAHAPEYRFEFPELWPGSYTVDFIQPPGAYVQRLRLGSQFQTIPGLLVNEGASLAVEIEAGIDHTVVSGVIKVPGGKSPCPHGRVALARSGTTPVLSHSVQADQKGRFLIRDVRPGEYLVRAWTRVDAASLYEAQTWEQSGPAVKRMVVEPNIEIELELTAAK